MNCSASTFMSFLRKILQSIIMILELVILCVKTYNVSVVPNYFPNIFYSMMKQILNSSYVGYVHRITVSLFTFIKYMTVIFHAFEQSWNFLAWVVKFFIFIIFYDWRCDCGCSEGSIFELQSNAIHFWLQNISS